MYTRVHEEADLYWFKLDYTHVLSHTRNSPIHFPLTEVNPRVALI
jgi:hypothetical protein